LWPVVEVVVEARLAESEVVEVVEQVAFSQVLLT
jgi:hypothetical protein